MGPGTLEYIQASFYGVMIALVIVCNSFALFILLKWQDDFESVSHILYRGLAFSDMFSGVTTAALEGIFFLLSSGPVADEICLYIPLFGIFTMFSTIYHVCLMNIQRYIAVCYPLRYVQILTPRRVVVSFVILKASLLAFCCTFLPYSRFPFDKFAKGWCRSKSLIFFFSEPDTLDKESTLMLITLGILYIIPFVTLTFINIRLLIAACRAAKRTRALGDFPNSRSTNQNQGNPKGSRRGHRPGLKGLRTVVFITGLYYLSVFPMILMIFLVLMNISVGKLAIDMLYFLANALLICSCWWNMPVYMSTSSVFRRRAKELRSIITSCCQRQRSVANTPSIVMDQT